MNELKKVSRGHFDLSGSILDRFDAVVGEHNARDAVVFGDVVLSYRQLDERADALAAKLQELGVKDGDLVGVASQRSHLLLVAVLGVLKAGAAYVPFDVSLPRERLEFMAGDTGITVMLGGSDAVAGLAETTIPFEEFPIDGAMRPTTETNAESLAYVMFTSGTTGVPKGVMVPHRAVTRLVVDVDWVNLDPQTVTLHSSAFAFDTSIIDIFGALLNGGCVVVPPDGPTSISVLAQSMTEAGVNTLWLTSGLFNAIADERPEAFERIEQLIVGGDIVSPVHVAKVRKRYPNIKVINGFGPTENGVLTTSHHIGDADLAGGTIPIGRNIPHSEVHLLGEDLTPVADGKIGEIYMAGRGVATGYWNRPDLTAEKFIKAPWDETLTLYASGDLASHRGDGVYEFFGRADGQLKIRGNRVELGEVEAAVEAFATIRQAAVTVRVGSDQTDKSLVAWYTEAEPVDLTALRAHLREKLPSYAIPTRFHALDAIPVNPNGKVDRKTLKGWDTDQPHTSVDEKPADSGRKDVVQLMTGIFAEVLETNDIDQSLNFFDLGASSLHVARVHARLESELDFRFPITDFFLHSTIDDLSTHLGASLGNRASKAAEVVSQDNKDTGDAAIAIVGMAGRFPGSPDIATFWDNIVNGRECISHFEVDELDINPNEHDADAQYIPSRGVMPYGDMFDAKHFGIPPREAERLDPQHRVLLETAQTALDDAGYDPDRFDGRIGVFCGASQSSYLLNNLVSAPGSSRELAAGYPVRDLATVFGNDKDFLATRLAYKLNLRGPAVVVQCACSTSLVAVAQGCDALRAGHADMVLAGGVSVTFPQKRPYLYTPDGMASVDGHCRTFDENSSGTVFGDGAGLVVLRRLDDALRDGDNIVAVIRGYAVNNDGSDKIGYAAPSIKAQSAVIKAAHKSAGIKPDEIGYVEAHGTGTPLGDPIEFAALTDAFGAKTDQQGFCALGSVKTNVGHLDIAAGITGLIKTALTLKNEEIPALLHYKRPNPRINFDGSAFYPVTENTEWAPNPDRRRIAAVTSLGVGGTNIHMVLEEAPAIARTELPRPVNGPQVYPLSANSGEALERGIGELSEWAQKNTSANPASVLATMRSSRRLYDQRTVLVADGMKDLARQADNFSGKGVAFKKRGKIAFMFPGQGAQHVGMGLDLYRNETVFREALSLCSTLLEPEIGRDLLDVIHASDADAEDATKALTDTALTQPAIFSVSYALAKQWAHWEIRPDALIGHSIGEFAAATIAGSMDLTDALHLIALRGRLMSALPSGTMMIVRATEDDLKKHLGDGVDLAAVNGAQACVVAGPTDRVEKLASRLEKAEIVTQKLHTSHAFHSHMMDPALDEFHAAVANLNLRKPDIPIMSTVTGDWLTDIEATDPNYWTNHMRAPVRFYDAIQNFWEQGTHMFLEVGPGRTLSTLAGQNPDRRSAQPSLASLPHAQAEDSDSHRFMLKSFGMLWAHGYDVDWSRLNPGVEGDAPRQFGLPTTPFNRKRFWVEPAEVSRLGLAVAAEKDEAPAIADEVPQLTAIDALRAMLHEVSGVEPEEMDGDAYFLELGFDSLMLTQAVKMISDRFAVTVSLRELIDGFANLNELADHIEKNGSIRGRAPSDRVTPNAESTRIERPATGAGGETPSSGPKTAINKSDTRDALTPQQSAHIDRLVERFVAKTRKSKELTSKYRRFHADPRTASGFNRMWKELVYQIVTKKSKGSRLIDVDGNEYIDILNGFGPGFLGHSPDLVVNAVKHQLEQGFEIGPQSLAAMEASELFCELTGNDRASFVCTGSEAVYAAMRLARTCTNRDKIVMFARDYHGNFDEVQVRGIMGSEGPRTMPTAPGVPQDAVKNAIVLPYGSPEALDYIRAHAHELAAVMVEPVQSRRPEFQPIEFIREVREITRNAGALFIFDEVVTGFRFGPTGAQGLYGVDADIVTYGKIPGGGMPIGVVAGKSQFMDTFDGGMWEYGDDSFPQAPVTFFAGTFVRHPIAMAALKSMLLFLRDQPEFFWKDIKAKGDRLAGAVDRWFEDNDMPFQMPNCGSLMYLRIAEDQKFGPLLGAHMRDRGVFILEGFPSYVTAAHDDEDIAYVVDAIKDSALEMRADGLITGREPVPYDGPRIVSVPARLSEPDGEERIAAAMTRLPETIAVPTIEAQREIWAAIKVNPELTAAYNESVTLTLHGAIHDDLMVRATEYVFNRHDALKSNFNPEGSVMFVRATCDVQVERIDMSGSDVGNQDDDLKHLVEGEVLEPFDMDDGPFVRAKLVKQNDTLNHLIITAHHIVCDGWSIDVIMRDISEVYSALCEGRAPKMMAADSIIDYARLEHTWNRSQAAADAEAYWKSQYQTLPPIVDLPTDNPRAPVRSIKGDRLDVEIPADLVGPLRDFAKARGCTFVNLLLTAYKVHVGRVTGLSDLVIGLPAAGQASRGMESVVGHCVNLLPIRTTIDWNKGFADYLTHVRGKLLDAFAYQDYTFGSLVKALKLSRDPSRATLVPVVFNIDNGIDLSSMDFGVQDSTFVSNPRKFEHFDLFLNVTDEGERVLTEWSYCADLFRPETIKAHYESYIALLRAALDRPNEPLGELTLPRALPRRENVTPSYKTEDLPAQYARTIGDVFTDVVKAGPDAEALVCGDVSISYAELEAAANKLAAALAQSGVQQGDHVGISTERGLRCIVAILGIVKAGAAYVPLPDYFPADRLAMIIEDASIKVAVGDIPQTTAALTKLIAPLPGDANWDEIPAEYQKPETTDHEATAYVMFTSGSTGTPKGVVVPHRAILRLVQGQDFMELGPDERILQNSPVAFDAATLEIWGALLNGGTLVLPEGNQLRMDELGSVIREHKVTSIWITAGLFHMMADEHPEAFKGLRQLLTGGDVVSPSKVAQVRDVCPDIRFINGYGPTENTTFTCCHTITDDDLKSGEPLPIGTPINGTGVFILDASLTEVHPGAEGELCAVGPGLAKGYLNRPDLTDDVFVEAPWDPSLTLYRTGDLARRDADGAIRYLGRIDNQVKIRGFRIELGEVEGALEEHPDVATAVVIAQVPADRSEKVLVAHMIAEGEGPSVKDLRSFLKDRLPVYSQPSHFVFTDKIPINQNGKVDRRKLAEVPVKLEHRALLEPSTETEKHLASIWKEALGIGEIDVMDNFFELGGHSLLAVKIFDRIRKQLKVDLPISTLFENQTVRELSSVIDATAGTSVEISPSETASDPWDTSTIIHPGPESSTNPPLFVVGGVGGNVNNLFELGKFLGEKRAVIGFQSRGILGHSLHTSIEDMAAENISYMRQHQPHGPYVLAGYSGGATTAFEMACQLEAKGEKVLRVFVLDTFAPGFDLEAKGHMPLDVRLKAEWKMLFDEGIGYFLERFRAKARSKLMRGPLLSAMKHINLPFYRVQKVESGWYAAYANYKGGTFSGDISLIFTHPRSISEHRAYSADPWLGWRRLANIDRLDRQFMQGDHLSMVLGDNAKVLAGMIDEKIDP